MPPAIITQPFAWNGEFILPPVSGDDTDDTISQEVGFPITQSTALGSGGVPVNRQETNGAFNLYSEILVYINTGGTFTFDTSVVDVLGGYSAGSILWCASANQFLISLIDSNIANFITTPSYINDGINWAFLSNSLPDITDSDGVVTITGSGGLLVDHVLAVSGIANLAGGASIGNSANGATVAIIRDTNTELGNNLYIKSESATAFPSGGTGNPWEIVGGNVSLSANYNSSNGRLYNFTASPGNTTAANAVALYGDIVVEKNAGISSFFFADSAFAYCRALGAVIPASVAGLSISGSTVIDVPVSMGNSILFRTIDLVALGVITVARGYNSYGTVSFSALPTSGSLQGSAIFDGQNIKIFTANNSGSSFSATISFAITI